MRYVKSLGTLVLLLAFSYCVAADGPPPLPKGFKLMLGNSGDSLWGDYDDGFQRRSEYTYQRLRASSGKLETIPLPVDFVASEAVPADDDVIAFGYPSVFPRKWDLPYEIVWYSPRSGVARATLPLQRRPSYMLALADRSVLLVGGRLRPNSERTNAIERVLRTENGLVIERLPDIPGPVRHGYALVALADGRAMVLGGSDYVYIGCEKCLADTYILDLKTRTWTVGPKMIEPRTDATATLLPDGSVLVAGGWTPGHSWNEEASRTTERWDPRRNTFTAGPRLPIAVAMQAAQWAAGGRDHLLLAGGMVRAWESNDAILGYDIVADQWRTVGENCQGDSKAEGRVDFGSRAYHGKLFAWCDSLFLHEERTEFPLRTSAIAIDGERGYALRRSGTTFTGGDALLAAGGLLPNTGTFSASVDLFTSDGQLRALASLNHARHYAQAFILPGVGYLVVGGVGGRLLDRLNERPKLPMEWLPAATDPAITRWQDLDPWFSDQSAVTQEADGSLLVVSPTGTVERLRIAAKEGQLQTERTILPSLIRSRISDRLDSQTVEVHARSLTDGRIVVAGGLLREQAIAVLDSHSLDEDAVDTYVEQGKQEISRHYDIYDANSRTWRRSVRAEGLGGRVAIIDTGQVVMLTPRRITEEQGAGSSRLTTPGMIEISSADGRSWRRIEPAPRIRLDNDARPFVLRNELLLAGETDGSSTAGTTLIEWYDARNQRWVTLWEAAPRGDWRESLGRVILRELNGQRMLIPVRGL